MTYNERGARTVAIRGRKNASKSLARFCTCQLLVNLDGSAAFMVVLFRGKGLRLPPAERLAYHEDIIVHFNPKGYYKDVECMRWATEDLPQFLQHHTGPHLMFMDNLSGQTNHSFSSALADIDVKTHYFVGGTTDICQPIDAGVGNFVHEAYQRSRDAWLSSKENSSRWFTGIPATELRILVTRWLGSALQSLRQRPDIIISAGKRTGCSMAPGNPGLNVKLQGLATAVIDYNDVGDEYADTSVCEPAHGTDGDSSDSDISDGDVFVNGSDGIEEESDAETEASGVSAEAGRVSADADDSHSTSSESSCDEFDIEAVDPLVLLPPGNVRLDKPPCIPSSIGHQVLVKVHTRRSRRSTTNHQEELRDWWSGTIVGDTKSSVYLQARKLGHNLVVKLDPAFERFKDDNDTFPLKSFELWLETYGVDWRLFGRAGPTSSTKTTILDYPRRCLHIQSSSVADAGACVVMPAATSHATAQGQIENVGSSPVFAGILA
eukprot:GHVU01233912.1.p1 GENE.GHVU01233912.1~~GHVU01233912.1.p1  ORF type:complete len:492 (-),score=48.91 GHVU01233912.1:1366-2841(-)